MRPATRGGWVVALVVAALCLPVAPAPADPSHGPAPSPKPSGPAPSITADPPEVLPRTTTGPKALRALDRSELATVADLNDTTTPELRRVLADETARVTPTGRIYHVDAAPARPTTAATPAALDFPTSETFSLHSDPASTRVIFLDFDGSDADGSDWDGLEDAPRAPFSIDADPSFSEAEHALMQETWARVAEDFAPFGVDVTTEDPGPAALVQSTPSDTTYGVRMLVTQDAEAADVICAQMCGGVAYLDVFTSGVEEMGDEPALDGWVFADMNWFEPHLLAGTISHEVGHTFGLSHDGTSSEEYHQGHGNWAPIMGAGFGRAIEQWSQGDYPDANNHEDDLELIGDHAPRRGDEHGDTPLAATDLGQHADYATAGVIGTAADRDLVRLDRTSCAGTLAVAARPADHGPNLDVSLRVLDSTGAELDAADPPSSLEGAPATGLDAALSLEVPAGVYFVEVDGVGAHDAASGYPDYGSLGAWSLTATGCENASGDPVAPQAPGNVAATTDDTDLSAALSWQAPAGDGGSPITGFTVRLGNGSPVSLPASARSHTFTGLAERTTYTLRVRAHNSVGAGAEQTVQVTTGRRLATAPRNLRVAPIAGHPGALTISWSAPASLHHPLQYYCLDLYGGLCFEMTETSINLTGFEIGETYTIWVWAVTEAGHGARAELTFVMPEPPEDAAPGVALSLRATASATSLQLTWAAPSGFTQPTHYRLGLNGRTVTTVPASTRARTFTGLARGRNYTMTVTALRNGVAGPTATLRKATLTTRPSAPKIGTASSGARGGTVTATARWGAPSTNGGASITSWKVTAHRLNSRGKVVARTTRTAKASARSLSMKLVKGRHRFTVVALNKKGASPSSKQSRIVNAQ